MSDTKTVSPLVEGFSKLSSEEVVNALSGIKPAATPPAAQNQPATPAAEPAAPASTPKPADDKTAPPAAAAKPAEKDSRAPAAKDKPAPDNKDVPATPAADDKNKGAAADPAKDAAAPDPDAPAPVTEFQLPEDKAPAKDGEVSEESSWKDVVKEFAGIDITEDTPEAAKAALETHYKSKYEINLGKYNAETQAVIEALEAGMTLEEYVKPTEGIDRLVALEDNALVSADLKARGWDDVKIAKELERLEGIDHVDLNAQHIREALQNKKLEIQKKITDSKINAAKRQDTYKSQTGAEHSKAIKNALNIVSDFMETPLGAKQKDFITSKEQKGEYANIFNDPKVKAEFLVWYEFGKQAITNLRNKSYNEGRDYSKKHAHNIPPATEAGNAGTRSSTAAAKGENSQWAALEGFEPALLGK